jgi:hypothetical protein
MRYLFFFLVISIGCVSGVSHSQTADELIVKNIGFKGSPELRLLRTSELRFWLLALGCGE